MKRVDVGSSSDVLKRKEEQLYIPRLPKARGTLRLSYCYEYEVNETIEWEVLYQTSWLVSNLAHLLRLLYGIDNAV